MSFFIKQAYILPLYFFIPVLTAGALVEHYDAIRQHASEITLTPFYDAKLILNGGAILTGLSCITLALGILLKLKLKFFLSAILLILFGISMISNGLYPIGNPMHGFYGMGLSLMILPFVVCYELKTILLDLKFYTITLVSGLLIFVYLWSMLVGFDPSAYKGLTQRLASVVIFGWLSYLAHQVNVLSLIRKNNR
ncbi:MAG: hypothetical protein K0R51_837 [Cytophagaceae bacterium]|jgi:hypothetical protein|nr:hypothetical protein [Cytophagaceae bacterium]